MTPENRKPLEASLVRIVVNAMVDIIAFEYRSDAQMFTEIKTVDGHSWSITVQWLDFTGPAKLSEGNQR
jgi:hypothetical protein